TGWVGARTRRRRSRRRRWRRSLYDCRSARRNGPPPGAEEQAAFAVRLTGTVVADVRIERVPVIGQLQCSVAASRHPEQRLPDTGARRRRSSAQQRRPEPRAAPIAGALPPTVLGEQVEGAASRVHQDGTELRPMERDSRARLSRTASDGARDEEPKARE